MTDDTATTPTESKVRPDLVAALCDMYLNALEEGDKTLSNLLKLEMRRAAGEAKLLIRLESTENWLNDPLV